MDIIARKRRDDTKRLEQDQRQRLRPNGLARSLAETVNTAATYSEPENEVLLINRDLVVQAIIAGDSIT